MPPDRPVTSDLEVGPAELVLDLLVALLDPVAQPIGADDLGELGLLGAAAAGAMKVAQQVPGGKLRQPGWVGGGHHQPVGPLRPPAAKAGVSGPPGLGVPIAEAAGDPPPLAGPARATPVELAGRLHRGVRLIGRRPGALAGLERQHERHLRGTQRLDKPGVVAVQAVGHHRPERNAGLPGRRDQRGGQLRLGPKPRVALALGKPGRRRVGHQVQRPVAARIGPQAGDTDDAVVGLADRAKLLAGHMVGVVAVLAVAGVVDHQHPPRMRRGGRVGLEQPDPLLVDRLVVPGRFRQEPLQPLHLAVLGTDDRLANRWA